MELDFIKEYFTIGETAEINTVSIKSLRHYDEIGLLKPAYIDVETRYRYYTYDQFIYIDKIKRFKSLGMSLKDIKDIFISENNTDIENFLASQRSKLNDEVNKLEQIRHNIDLLTEYFKESKRVKIDGEITVRTEDTRYVIYALTEGSKDIYEMDMQLRNTININKISSNFVINPYGYILDIERFKEGEILFTHSYVTTNMYMKSKKEYTMEIPQGEYICFKSILLSPDVEISKINQYLKNNNIKIKLIIANEYVKSYYDPIRTPYEIQILVEQMN